MMTKKEDEPLKKKSDKVVYLDNTTKALLQRVTLPGETADTVVFRALYAYEQSDEYKLRVRLEK